MAEQVVSPFHLTYCCVFKAYYPARWQISAAKPGPLRGVTQGEQNPPTRGATPWRVGHDGPGARRPCLHPAMDQAVRTGSTRPKALLATVAAGVLVTLLLPGSRRPLWLDESASATLAALPGRSFWQVALDREGNGIAHTLLLRGWRHVAPGDLGLRVPSLMLAALSVVLLVLLAERLLGRWAAMLSVPLLVGNPVYVRYAVEARTYALVLVVACTSGLLLLRAVRRPTTTSWVVYGLVTGLGVYAHYFVLLLPLAHLCAVLLRRPDGPGSGPRLLAHLVPGGVAFIVAAAGLLRLAGAGGAGGVGYLQGSPFARLVVTATALLLPLAGVVLAVALNRRARSGRPVPLRVSEPAWSWVLLVSWLVVPLAAAVVVSLVSTPLLAPRYLIICLPPAVLLLAGALARLGSRTATAIAGVAAVVGVLLGSAYVDRQSEDWPSAARTIQTAAAPGDGVLFLAPYVRIPFARYWDGAAAERAGIVPVLPSLGWRDDPSPLFSVQPLPGDSVAAAVAGLPRVWVVVSHVQLYGGADPIYEADQAALRATFVLTMTQPYHGVLVQRWDRR